MIFGYDKSGKPDVSWWMDQLRQGIEWRKKCANQKDWDRWRSYYRGHWPVDTLPVNLFFRMIRTTVPKIYFRNPSISVTATKPGLEQQLFAQLVERVDNKLVRTMDVKNQIKRIVQNTWMFGTGAGKIGYGAEFTPTPELFDTAAPEENRASLNRRIEYNSTVNANMPWFQSVHTGSLIVPKGLMQFNSTPWVAMHVRRPIDDVQADSRLKNVRGLNSNTSRALSVNNDITLSKDRSSVSEIDLYEIRDRRTRKVIILAPFVTDRVLYYGDDDMQSNGRANIYPTVFNPDDENFWGVPDSIILEPQQLEINDIRTLQMKHHRLSLLKLLYRKGAISKDELDKMLSGDVMAAVEITGELSDIDTFELAKAPDSLYAAAAEVQADVRDQMGFSRNQSGEYASQKSHNAPTAFEAQIVQAASEIRVDERRDAIADMLVNVFEDVNVLVFDKWADDEVVQVMGPNALPVWVAFKPAMLKAARYELQIEPDTTLPITKDMREAKAGAVYERFKTNPLIDPMLLTKYYLREMHGVQFDDMIRTVYQNAAAGVPGSSPDTPINSDQFMQMMINQKTG